MGEKCGSIDTFHNLILLDKDNILSKSSWTVKDLQKASCVYSILLQATFLLSNSSMKEDDGLLSFSLERTVKE